MEGACKFLVFWCGNHIVLCQSKQAFLNTRGFITIKRYSALLFFSSNKNYILGEDFLSAESRNFTRVPWLQVEIADMKHKQIIGSGLNPRNEMNTFKPWYTHLFPNQQVLPSWEPLPNSPSLLLVRPLKFKDFLVHLCLHPSPSVTWSNSLAFMCRSECRQKVERTLSISRELSAENWRDGCVSSLLRNKEGWQLMMRQQFPAAKYPRTGGTQAAAGWGGCCPSPAARSLQWEPELGGTTEAGTVIQTGTATWRRGSPARGTAQRNTSFHSPVFQHRANPAGNRMPGKCDPSDARKGRKWVWLSAGTWSAWRPGLTGYTLTFRQSNLHTLWTIFQGHCCNAVTSNSSSVSSMMAAVTSAWSTLELCVSSSKYLVQTSTATETVPIIFT